jgi:hypothetical protein
MRYVVNIFDKDDERFVDEVILADELTVEKFCRIFDCDVVDEAFDCRDTGAAHVPLLMEFTDHVFNLARYDYQVSAYSD